MGVRFVLGRAGSGKTTFCLDEIRERLLRDPVGPPLVLLVPEQATFQAERQIVSTPGLGGTIRAQALSFRRLAWRVMQETGGTARIRIDDTGKQMLLYHLLERMKDELRAIRASAERLGYLAKLAELFTEFRRYGVTAERLASHAERAGLKEGDPFGEMVRVYEAFERLLGAHYVDAEDDLLLLAARLHASSYITAAEVWVDGFTGFTPPEAAVLAQLMRHCRRVTITLCAPEDRDPEREPDEFELFHPTYRTLRKLKRLADEAGVAREPTVVLGDPAGRRFLRSPMLAELERCFERRHQGGVPVVRPFPGSPGIALIAAPNRRAEAEAVARAIIGLVRDEGFRYREIAVMVRNMDAYADLLRQQFDAYGIPFFVDYKRPVTDHPLVELIRSALDAVLHGWSYDAVFRCVKTEFLLPLSDRPSGETDDGTEWRYRHGFDKLENYVLATGIRGRRWTDGKPWRLAAVRLEDGSLSGGGRPDTLAEEKLLAECRELVARPLHAFERRLKRAGSVREMAAALFGLLEDVRAADRLERWAEEDIRSGRPEAAREHEQVWELVMRLLDQLVEMLGDQPMPVERFARLVASGLDGMKLALVPPSLDQVLIGSLERTRSDGIRACFLLGVNDGVFPARPREDSLLAEQERTKLAASGLELAEDSRRRLLDEPFLLYTAVTLPSERLIVSYPLADEEGKALLPSDFVRHLRRMLPGLREEFVPADDADGLSDEEWIRTLAHPRQGLSRTIAELRKWAQGRTISDIWWEAYNWFCARPEWREPLARLLRSFAYGNREEPLDPGTSRDLYGTHIVASVSRLERFASCPFSHFAEYGLRLRERRLFKLEAPDVGQLFHAALSEIANRVGEGGRTWADYAAETIADMADRAVDELAPRLQHEILLSSARYRYLTDKLRQTVRRAAAALAEHGRRGAFIPAGTEIPFGPDGRLPPLVFQLENGCTLEMIGRIDRVDVAERGGAFLLRIIDYKSGRTELDLSDVYYGLSLQMLTYLDVLLTHAEAWLGRRAEPAGVLYFRVHNPLVRSANGLSPEAAESERLKRFKMKGLLLADPEAVRLMDGGLAERAGVSAIVPAGLKADGGFYASSSVADGNQWDRLRHHVRRTIRRLGTELTNGRVAIEPYRSGSATACAFCPYRPVCQFDPLLEDNRYRELQPIPKDRLWEMLEREPAGETDGTEDGDAGGGDRSARRST